MRHALGCYCVVCTSLPLSSRLGDLYGSIILNVTLQDMWACALFSHGLGHGYVLVSGSCPFGSPLMTGVSFVLCACTKLPVPQAGLVWLGYVTPPVIKTAAQESCALSAWPSTTLQVVVSVLLLTGVLQNQDKPSQASCLPAACCCEDGGCGKGVGASRAPAIVRQTPILP